MEFNEYAKSNLLLPDLSRRVIDLYLLELNDNYISLNYIENNDNCQKRASQIFKFFNQLLKRKSRKIPIKEILQKKNNFRFKLLDTKMSFPSMQLK